MKQLFTLKKNTLLLTTLLVSSFLLSSCAHKGEVASATDSSAMDNQLEEDAPVSKKAKSHKAAKKPVSRGIASISAAGSFATTAQACAAYENESKDSKLVKNIAGGKQIWTEKSAKGWYKIYLKNSAAYVEANCFE